MTRWGTGNPARIGIFAILAGLAWTGTTLAQSEAADDETEIRAAVAAMLDDFLNNRPGQLLSLGNLGINRPFFDGTARGDVYTGDRYHVEYYGLRDDGEPTTVTINIIRGDGDNRPAQ